MDKLAAGLGEHFETRRVGFKPYAAGGSTHTAHEAVKGLMEEANLTADMIHNIEIHTTTATFKHTYWEYKPEGVTAAQMNIPYVVAVTALEGNIFIDQFTEEKIKDPRIIEFSRKVGVNPDPELDKLGPEFRHVVIAEITTVDGRTFSRRVETARGSDLRPMSTDEVISKFRLLAGKVLSDKRIDELQNAVQSLENMDNVSSLANLLAWKSEKNK